MKKKKANRFGASTDLHSEGLRGRIKIFKKPLMGRTWISRSIGWITALAGLVALVMACQSTGRPHPPGIALSFDDRFIHEWYQLRPLFKKYNARVTFYITQFDSLSKEEIGMLRTLQRDGHEIGCHGAIHTNSIGYVWHNSMAEYLKDEIDASVIPMQQNGFRPTSFAHPGGAQIWYIDRELLKRFLLLRDVAVVERKLFGFTFRWNIRNMSSIYYIFDGDQTVNSLLFDEGAGLSGLQIKTALQKAGEDKSVLMAFGHKPYWKPIGPGEYGFRVARLDSLLAESQRLGLKTYTMSELVRESD